MTAPSTSGRVESGAQVFILLAVAAMAGVASFTHVHDWTMDNSPEGTWSLFGWANAAVSELIPLATGLEIRRRRRLHLPIGRYPILLIAAAVALSLAGQFAEAKPSLSGWLVAAVPALGFLALAKLVLSTPTPVTQAIPTVDPDPVTPEPAQPEPTDIPALTTDQTTILAPEPEPEPEPVPALPPVELLPGARLIARSHEQATGTPITAAVLAERMNLSTTTAHGLLAALNEHTPARAGTHNGHPYPVGP